MEPHFNKTMVSTLLKDKHNVERQHSPSIVNSLNLGSAQDLLHKFDPELVETREDNLSSDNENSKRLRPTRHMILVDGHDLNSEGKKNNEVGVKKRTGQEVAGVADLDNTLDMHFQRMEAKNKKSGHEHLLYQQLGYLSKRTTSPRCQSRGCSRD